MQNKFSKNIVYTVLICCFLGIEAVAQSSKTSVETNERFDEMLKEKQKYNISLAVNDRYKIQIYYGNSAEAQRILSQYKRDFGGDGVIVFYNPNYRVLVGSYEYRLYAEKALTEIKKKYPSAILIKPNK